jgi:hypothetical protein
MRNPFLSAIALAAMCLLLCAQETRAQYAYGASGIGYDPNTKVVYGYSRTSVDYYAGTYYDPYVEGYLFDPNYLLDWGYSRGYESYYPAVVETAAFTSPSTRYDVLSDHYVISWYSVSVTVCDYYGFYGGCGYDPYGFGNFFGGSYGGFNYFYGNYGGYVPERTYYLGTTGISGVTPPPDECEGDSAASAMSADATSAPQAASGGTGEYEPASSTSRDTVALAPASSCTVLPKVSVTQVGFKGDYKITRWAKGVKANQTIIDPGDNEPTWVKNRDGNGDFPVAYKMGTRPVIFAKLAVERADNTTAKIRARKGSTVITGEYTVTLDGGEISLTDIPLTADLEATPKVKRSSYDFSWEVLFENQTSWKSAGSSGDHEIHWVVGDSKKPEFRDPFLTPYEGLFDRALDHATGEMGEGSANIGAIITEINRQLAEDIVYDPGRTTDANVHPLALFDGREAQCSDNAELLRGLLRSIGIDATAKYYWGGNKITGRRSLYKFGPGEPSLRVDSDELIENIRTGPLQGQQRIIPNDPHFLFHAVVNANAKVYDPSYGRERDNMVFLETYDAPTRTFKGPANVADNLVEKEQNHSSTWGEDPAVDRCPHSSTAGTGGTTNSTAYVTQSVPAFMEAGQLYLASVTMRNTGDTTWTEDELYRLGAQSPQDNYTWGLNRVTLPNSVPPGGEVTFNFYVTAPSSAGSYDFQWRMVRDGVEWFGNYTDNTVVNVTEPFTYCKSGYWQEENCSMQGGYFDYSTCSCQYGYYYY